MTEQESVYGAECSCRETVTADYVYHSLMNLLKVSVS